MRWKTGSLRCRRLGLALAIAMIWLNHTALAQKHYQEIKFPPLRKFEIPRPQRVVLDNGMIVFLIEDHELPLVEASLLIGAGSAYDPGDKVGLAAIATEVIRTGGSTSRSGDAIDSLLERSGTSVELSAGLLTSSAYISALKEHAGLAFEILSEILRHPAFPPEKIELAKIAQRTSIARRNDNPMQIVNREFFKLIYGADSPYARHTEYATIDAITREDLVAYHRAYFHPNNFILGVWGDFDSQAMLDLVKSYFGSWPRGEVQKPSLPPVNYQWDYTVNFVQKPDLNQSYIMLGHIGGIRSNPDYFTWEVMNEILGGSFTSRLFRVVRSRMGLAYSVFGTYGANYNYPGVFYVGCQTKLGSTVKAIRAMLDQVRSLREKEVSDEELAQAKESFLNSFVFNFDSKREIVERLMTYEYYGYPPDFLDRLREGVSKVTKQDILRVAHEYLRPDQVRILVVGKEDGLDEPLSVLGPVRTIDITIPQ
ncbi:MAG: insulinase family protein [candidate division KSB1 bacterium]|nr:insulinase family protein [candidate division KSB1 bacterium]